jgi:hypothetical protein
MQSLGKPDYMISGRPSTPITWPPTRSTVRNLKLAYKYRVATESQRMLANNIARGGIHE